MFAVFGMLPAPVRFVHINIRSASRCIYTSSCLFKNTRSGVIRRSRNMSEPLTYEQAKKPHQINVMKSWNSWNTANLHNETHYTGVVTLQDALIRLFIRGTFPTHVLSEVILFIDKKFSGYNSSASKYGSYMLQSF